MKVSSILFAAIIFSMMSYSAMEFYRGIGTYYTAPSPAEFSYDYEGVYNEAATVSNQTEQGVLGGLNNWISNLPAVGVVWSELKITGGVLTGLLSATNVMMSMVTSLLSNIPGVGGAVPMFLVKGITAAAGLIVALAIIAWIMRSDG